MSHDQKIIDRIRAMLAKADVNSNPNEHERDIAMQRAQAMMAKHQLEMADLLGQSASGEVLREGIEITGVQDCEWSPYVYNSMAQANFVKVIVTKIARNHQIVYLIGRPDNVAYVKVLAEHTIPWLKAECKESIRNEVNVKPKAFTRAFMRYAGSRIYQRLEAQRRTSGFNNQLIVKEDAHNDKAVEKFFGQTSKSRAGRTSNVAGAMAGAAAGNRADLTPGKKLGA